MNPEMINKIKGIQPIELELDALEIEPIKQFRDNRVQNYVSDKMQLDEDLRLLNQLVERYESIDPLERTKAKEWLDRKDRDDSTKPKTKGSLEAIELIVNLPLRAGEVENLRERCLFHLKMIRKYNQLLSQLKKWT